MTLQQEIIQALGAKPQIDAADLIGVGAPLHHAAQRHAPDAAETVDAHFDRHKHSPLLIHWGLSPVFPSVSV